MRRLLVFSALAALLAVTPAFAAKTVPARTLRAKPAPAPAISGLWKLPDNNVIVRIHACGPSVCGNLVSADKLKSNPQLKDKMNKDESQRARPVRGLPVLFGFTGGPAKWSDGKVYNPDDGRTYKSEMTLADADTLKLTGCVVKPLCKSTTLTRAR
jgi:uncharacterized protein (DUF2147 family)